MAVALHLAPEQVWRMDPVDFATVLDVLFPEDDDEGWLVVDG